MCAEVNPKKITKFYSCRQVHLHVEVVPRDASSLLLSLCPRLPLLGGGWLQLPLFVLLQDHLLLPTGAGRRCRLSSAKPLALLTGLLPACMTASISNSIYTLPYPTERDRMNASTLLRHVMCPLKVHTCHGWISLAPREGDFLKNNENPT